MKIEGIVFYATESAKKNKKKKEKRKKNYCPNCVIKQNKTNDGSFDVYEIKDTK
jgi:hypothetical protein